jgi:hypothetical protein
VTIRAALPAALIALLPLAAAAQTADGPVSGTLDCPARSFFDSGSTPVTGSVRGGEMRVQLPGLLVSGRILGGNAQAVRLEGSTQAHAAAFTGVVMSGGRVHARGTFDDRPCNLNLVMAAGAPAPQPAVPVQPAAQPGAQPAATGRGMEGAWVGTVSCPTRALTDNGDMPARGQVRDNVLTLNFGDARVQGRIIGMSPVPVMRLEGGGPRTGGASFDGVVVTLDRIHARGLVNDQPCNINITPARGAPAPAPVPSVQAPAPRPQPQQAALPAEGKPAPIGGATPAPVPPPAPSLDGKPAATNLAPPPPPPPPAGREVVSPRTPSDSMTPRVAQPAAPPPPAPVAAAPRAPSSAAADQLACALAGNCPSPGTPPR